MAWAEGGSPDSRGGVVENFVRGYRGNTVFKQINFAVVVTEAYVTFSRSPLPIEETSFALLARASLFCCPMSHCANECDQL